MFAPTEQLPTTVYIVRRYVKSLENITNPFLCSRIYLLLLKPSYLIPVIFMLA